MICFGYFYYGPKFKQCPSYNIFSKGDYPSHVAFLKFPKNYQKYIFYAGGIFNNKYDVCYTECFINNNIGYFIKFSMAYNCFKVSFL